MPEYNAKVRMYYGDNAEEESRLIPAPVLNISTELSYSNDTIIGYNYVINLTGQITAAELDGSKFGVGAILDHAYKIRKLLSQNGSVLTVTNEYDSNIIIFKAKGGILRSFNISDSTNNWISSVNYTATIDFQSVDFLGTGTVAGSSDPETCGDIFLDDNTYTLDSPGILDIKKFKIKSFEDNWSFNFDENEAYNRIADTENGNAISIINNGFTINYSINATGKNAYVYTDEDTSDVKIVPAWEQAKNFVQYRLYNQITSLLGGVLDSSDVDACAPSKNLSNLGTILDKTSTDGLWGPLNSSSRFNIFNETVNCNVSESEGTYSVEYSAIVKRNFSNDYSTTNTRHRLSKSLKTTNSNGILVTNISIEGQIEGLMPGGIINSPNTISLPEKGSFASVAYKDSSGITTGGLKYANAKDLLDKLYYEYDYNSGIGNSGKRDLKIGFKTILDVTSEELGVSVPGDDLIADPPHPISFNLTHDYINGTINYSAEYSSSAVCGRKHRETSIQTTASTKVFAQFTIPNSGGVPLFQDLNTRTAQSITITVTGLDLNFETHYPFDLKISNVVSQQFLFSTAIDEVTIPYPDAVLTSNQHTKNLIDGSFTITKTFICTTGC